MKKFMYMCMMLLAATLTFTACGSDDDDDNGGGNNQQQQQEINQDNYYKYQESVNIKGAGTMIIIGEATFDKGVCTAMVMTYIYPTKKIANATWEEFQNDPSMEDELPKYTYDGDKTMTYTFDNETIASMSVLGKNYVCGIVKSTVQDMVAALSGN